MSYAVLQQKIMSLPEEYINIVSAYIDSLPPVKDKEKKSARGIAAKYANPALIEKENEVMSKAFGEKYEKLNKRLI